jgi:hypothetical protein
MRSDDIDIAPPRETGGSPALWGLLGLVVIALFLAALAIGRNPVLPDHLTAIPHLQNR